MGCSCCRAIALVLATDGLDTLKPERITGICQTATTSRNCVQMLLDAVEKANRARQDNTTVVVVDVRDSEPSDVGRSLGSTMRLSSRAGVAEENAPKEAPAPVRPAPLSAPDKARSSVPMWIFAIATLAVAAGGYWWWFTGRHGAVPGTATGPVAAGTEPATGPDTGAEPDPVPAQPAPLEVPEVEAQPPFRDALASGGEGPAMVLVEAVRYLMGAGGLSTDAAARPQHEVALSSFAIGQFEVTVAEYAAFANATGRNVPQEPGAGGAARPVTGVSWDDANAYAAWLAEQTGQRYRLPTEAEWEFIAGLGKRTDYWWGTKPGTGNAHCFDCSARLGPTAPVAVGTFAPNALGVHDTAGNAAEWVADCYVAGYNDAPADGSARLDSGARECAERVLRGGSYALPAKSMRVTLRAHHAPGFSDPSTGVRVARDP